MDQFASHPVGNTLFDIPRSIRASHPNLAKVFDCSTGLIETLIEVWSVSAPLVWAIRKMVPEERGKWDDAIRRLPAQLDDAKAALSPLIHEIVSVSAMRVRLYVVERDSPCEAVIALGDTVIGFMEHFPPLDNPGWGGQGRESVVLALQQIAELHPLTTSWNNLRSFVRNEIIATARVLRVEDGPTKSEGIKLSDAPLLDLLSIWESRQNQPRRIVECLWGFKRWVSWDSLPQEAFRGSGPPTDEAILKALKRIQTDLGQVVDRFRVDLEILESERRVRLVKPSDKPDN